uniref:O-fucosyltransferase family protein n=1 Tax=Rhizophora mucronata TaxID=61149 RepID=A0A2P2PKV6_RHIMU
MAKSKNNAKKVVSYISVPSEIINSMSSSSLECLLLTPKKAPRNKFFGFNSIRSPKFWFFALFLFGFLGMIRLWFNLDRLVPFSSYPCLTTKPHQDPFSNEYPGSQLPFAADAAINELRDQRGWFATANGLKSDLGFPSNSAKVGEEKDSKLLISNHGLKSAGNEEMGEFWKQPDGLGYRPCLKFSEEYKKSSEVIVRVRRKYLLVVVSGGINQQKNQIVDAVVIARILGAALVVPILQVNVIWGDESEFTDIFDLEHFKRVLANDVRIVSSLPSTHIMTRPVEEKRTPLHVSPQWIRSRYLRRLNREGVLLLRGLDSRLSKDLPSDLQKLRCKVT